MNEIFGEHYTGEEPIRFLPNEHFINQQDANTKEKITDSCFIIYGTENKKHRNIRLMKFLTKTYYF